MLSDTPRIAVTLNDIYDAAERIAKVTVRTPLVRSDYFSRRYGYNIAFKCENLQHTGAFKLRGAYNKIAMLPEDERKRGLIAASSGNHAQGVAYAAHAFGIDHKTRIFVPESTPQMKIDNTRRFGDVQIELVQGTFDDANRLAHQEAQNTGATFIEPYDDWQIIAGQGTIGLEIMQDAPETNIIIVPVGGGGLISGISLAAHALSNHVRLYGVRANFASPSGQTVADGIRVKHPGQRPSPTIETYVESIVYVDEPPIERAMIDLLQHRKILVEGAGAIGLAALATHTLAFAPDTNIVIVLSGGNVDMKRIAHLLA